MLRLWPVANFNYSFDPNAAVPIPDVGTVYETARVTDEWGVLSVASGGVLLVRSDAGITEVVVPVPPEAAEPPTSGEGWRLELADGWGIEPGQRPGDWTLVKR